MLVDRTRENCQSWQLIKFAPRPVVFIRIVGTHNTANEVFIQNKYIQRNILRIYF